MGSFEPVKVIGHVFLPIGWTTVFVPFVTRVTAPIPTRDQEPFRTLHTGSVRGEACLPWPERERAQIAVLAFFTGIPGFVCPDVVRLRADCLDNRSPAMEVIRAVHFFTGRRPPVCADWGSDLVRLEQLRADTGNNPVQVHSEHLASGCIDRDTNRELHAAETTRSDRGHLQKFVNGGGVRHHNPLRLVP